MPDDLFPESLAVDFTPSRQAGLARLRAFTPRMGRAYADTRNHDLGPGDRSNVSALSPWVRTRQLLESELVEAALSRFALSTAEKFVQEVCWRTYFKGWMEHRPAVWSAYEQERDRQLDFVGRNGGLRRDYEAAITGATGIDCFDAWARELVETGYLHNHARMWFASIWMYTLNLPWELGADFFLQHLMDGDAASNTLSWRWVGGLHTQGKTYLARASNIRTYTHERFDPKGLAANAPPLNGFANPRPQPPRGGDAPVKGPILLLLTEEDLNVETLASPAADIRAVAGLTLPDASSPNGAGKAAKAFVDGAMEDALSRAQALLNVPTLQLDPTRIAEHLADTAREASVTEIVTALPPVGWVRPVLDEARKRLLADGIRLSYVQRDWDRAFWPHATKGFFALKERIPSALAELGITG